MQRKHKPSMSILNKCTKEFILVTIFIAQFFIACGPPKCKEDIIVKHDGHLQKDNQLRYDISISTVSKGDVIIKYWKTNEKGKSFFSKKSIDTTEHLITLSLLNENENYSYKVLFNNDKCFSETKPYSFSTNEINVPITPLTWEKFTKSSYNGYILLQRRSWNGNVHLLDPDGKIVWYQRFEGEPKVSHWTNENKILVILGNDAHKNSSGSEIMEYDLSGNRTLYFGGHNFPYEAHHEVRLTPQGYIATLAYESRVYDLSTIGGNASQSITGDCIVILDREGNLKWKWSVFDHLDPRLDPNILEHMDDWGHANAFSYDIDGNILISFRDWNQIWKIDNKSGEIIWKFGQNGDFNIDKNYYFSAQHDIHINPFKEYMIFDNGKEKRKTRLLSFKLNEINKTAYPRLCLEMPDEFYADRMGSSYVINKNNLLVCIPRSRKILVMDKKGKVLCQAHVGIPDPYRAEYIPIEKLINNK
ncbi:aryl-sulfate sulfotransferase [Sabulilitoribacter arenilitoris]|uniref:Aryl-sulfate sulfotransferase n=1 Tax=Wocania arenilitoris TaxID=2044858 RepID=A0AAE3EKP3_9FLAO|nr:aryl-sulfate sulfotransferase [Wocania arenilitoris]MCF7567058.1 aryl-sulfate sulfotransferase [Wocania arenilitoris]